MSLAPQKFPKSPYRDEDPKCRFITHPKEGGWTDPVLMVWELTGESWTDEHAHDEYAYVIEGQLFVESGGVTVEANEGDTVRVPTGTVGHYYAPKYARIFGVYGPNLTGEPVKSLSYKKLPS